MFCFVQKICFPFISKRIFFFYVWLFFLFTSCWYGHEFEQTLGDSEGQGSLACCSPWGCKELDMTEWLNNRHVIGPDWVKYPFQIQPTQDGMRVSHVFLCKAETKELTGEIVGWLGYCHYRQCKFEYCKTYSVVIF